ncbi:MAG: hypothetical protein RR630_02550 [Coprobacillus sp.]
MKKDSKWLGMLVQLAMGACIGGFVGYNVSGMLDKQELSIVILITAFFAFILAFIVQVIIHEAGHLIFGLISGYQFVSFRIGNLMWIKENNHIVLKRFSLAGTGGQCLLAPPPYQDNHYPSFLYNIGGCLFNIIISLISILLYFLFKDNTILSLLCLIMALFGFYLALMNGIPLKLGGVNNDGFNALKTHKDPLSKRAFWLTLKINELNSQNIRLKDIDDDLFLDLKPEDIQNDLTSSLLVVNFQRTLDQHDFEKAKSILHFIDENNIPILGIHQNILTNDQIFCSLVSQDNTDIQSLYTKEFKQFIKAMKKYLGVIRTQYAYELLYNKDELQAQKHLDDFQQVIKTYPYQCDIDSEKELMNYAYQIYRQHNTSNNKD